MPNRFRLNLVKPPEPVSTGKPVDLRTSNNFQRVALTAAVSEAGVHLNFVMNQKTIACLLMVNC